MTYLVNCAHCLPLKVCFTSVTSLISLASKEKPRWVKWGWGIHKPLAVVQFLIFSLLNCGLSLGYHRVRSYRDTWNAKMQNGIAFSELMINFPALYRCLSILAIIYIFFSLLYICMDLQTSAKLSCWGSRGFLSLSRSFLGARCSRVNIIY